MVEYNNNLIAGIALICFSFIYFIPLLSLAFAQQRGNLTSWTRLKSFLNSDISPNFQHSPALIVNCIVGFVFIVAIVIIAIGASKQLANSQPNIDRSNTTVNVPGTSGFGNVENFGDIQQTYKAIGYGPAMDTVKVQNWLQGSAGSMGLNLSSGNSAWPDGNGTPISIPTDQFKALYGFIPPSFSYYPKGQATNDYNGTNYQSGREDCMKACSYTNCIAVQTEVPENCSQQAPATGTGNACGTNAAFSCTLFYDSISSADDAYWSLGNYSSTAGVLQSPGCFEETGSACIGKKYYEDSTTPASLPNKNIKPSSSNVKFCGPNVTKTNGAGYGIVANSCSCNGPVGGDGCNDANCCVMRPIIATEYIQNSHPYFSLPINVSKAATVNTGDYSMVVPSITYKNGTPTSCGIVGSSGSQSLVSCTQSGACASASDTNDCWTVDPNAAPQCTGNAFDQSTGASALSTYQANAASQGGQNYDDLYTSCYYRQQLTAVQPVQFNCDPNTVIRGCSGSPPIIQTSELTNSGGFTACSDTNPITGGILATNRCQNSSDVAGCTGFPYSCGTNNGTNSLWIRQ